MTTPNHKRNTEAIIRAIQQVNPYTTNEGRIGYVYAAGFLASYLASLAEEDPWILKRYLKHCDDQARLRRESKRQNHK